MRKLSFLLAASVVLAQAPAPDPVPAQLLARVGEHGPMMKALTELTDRGPRLTGTAGEAEAHAWAKARFEAMGLSVRTEPWSLSRTWRRGPARGRVGGHELILAQLGWTPSTGGTVRGPLVFFDPTTCDDLASFKGRLKGAIVVYGKPDTQLEKPMMAPPLRLKKGNGTAEPHPVRDPGRPTTEEKLALLRREGALAILRDAGKPRGLLEMDAPDPDMWGTALPMARVVHDQFLTLHRLATSAAPGAEPTAELQLDGDFGPAGTSFNTVAELKGTGKPEEMVILGAHLDSWDLATGATDNGAGVAAVMEAARLLATSGAKPRRTIRFVLFSGEEQGYLGSEAYVKAHQDELAHVSAVFVMDTGAGRIDGIALQGRKAVEADMMRVVAPLRPLGVVDTDLRWEDGTDHIPFHAAGVPAFCMEQVQDGYSLDHHAESDTLDKVKPQDLHQAATVMAYVAYQVANLPGMLPRK